jgi:hypothetical protein
MKQGIPETAKFIAVMGALVPLCKSIVPLGWDLNLIRIIFPEELNEYSRNIFDRAIKNTLVSGVPFSIILVLFLVLSGNYEFNLISATFASLAFISFVLVALNQTLLSAFRNSSKNISTQNSDIFYVSIFPNISFIGVFIFGYQSTLMYMVLFLMGSLMQNRLLAKLLHNHDLKITLKRVFFKKDNGQSEPLSSGQLPAILLVAFNTRLPIILVSLILSSSNFVLVDLMSKASFLVALISWSGGILLNARYIQDDIESISSYMKRQMKLALFGWVIANILIGLFLYLVYQTEYQEWSNSLNFQVFFVLVSLFEIPVAVGGYLLFAKARFKEILVAQAIFTSLLFFTCLNLSSETNFLVYYVLGSAIRSVIYLLGIRNILSPTDKAAE